MTIDHLFDENQPIYLQIVQRIHAKILRGEYQPGEKLPSVIEAAMIYKVNHNTIARVYSELVRSGVAEVRRGEGTFVTQDQSILATLEKEMNDTVIDAFVSEITALGYSLEDVLPLLRERFAAQQVDQSIPSESESEEE